LVELLLGDSKLIGSLILALVVLMVVLCPTGLVATCKGNLTISANIVRYLQGKTKVNYLLKYRKYVYTPCKGKPKRKV
jgi:hypothetical protein